MRKSTAAAAMTASLLIGAGAGIALFGPSGATAQTTAGATSSSDTTATTSGTNNAGGSSGSTTDPTLGARADAWIQSALKGLVDDGTITQAQADAVAKALEAAIPHHDLGPGPVAGVFGSLDAAAKAIGIDPSALRDELRAGKSIADVAKEHNVDVQTVIDAMVGDLKSHLSDAVKAGHLTQEQADKIAADATQRITELVNGKAPAFGPGPFGGHPFGHGPGHDDSNGSGSGSGSGGESTTTTLGG
jgi:hypothetical protein